MIDLKLYVHIKNVYKYDLLVKFSEYTQIKIFRWLTLIKTNIIIYVSK